MVDQSKLEKLNKLKELGVDPYPYSFNQTHHADEIIADYGKLEGKKVSAAGRIIRMRSMGKLYFLDLLDGSGKIQILVREDTADPKAMQVLRLGDINRHNRSHRHSDKDQEGRDKHRGEGDNDAVKIPLHPSGKIPRPV